MQIGIDKLMSALINPNKPRLLNDTICDRIEKSLAAQAWFEVEFPVQGVQPEIVVMWTVSYWRSWSGVTQLVGTVHAFNELTVNCFGKLTNSWWNAVYYPVCEPASQWRVWIMAD